MSTLFSHFFQKINQISPLESNFTEELADIAVMPKILYFYGKMPENMPKVVSIVGARKNTKYGEEVAYKLAYELARRGVVVVSGLAIGIDSIAHRGALDAGGITVAVLGSPIDEIYPRSHTRLAEEIIEKGGAVISEYGPGEVPAGGDEAKMRFLHRNRIVSGLADAVIVVEAAARSGTLNTAAHALEQGKEVFAVPGNITNLNSVGCNRLIKQGAMPLTGVEDVLEALFPEEMLEKSGKVTLFSYQGETETERAIIKLMKKGVREGEEMIKEARISVPEFSRTMTMLEVKGVARSLGANRWCLK